MKFTQEITPRFCETDALGHINNTVFFQWFELGREPIFKIFTPDLDPKKWQLILARTEIDFLKQTFYGHEVKIDTFFSKIGNSSMTVEHRAYQKNECVASGKAILIFFDYKEQKSRALTSNIKNQLSKYLH